MPTETSLMSYALTNRDGIKYGLQYLAGAVFLGLAGFHFGGLAWLLMWPMFSLVVVSAGYLWLGAGVFGKRPDGTRPWYADFILLPFLAANRAVWHGIQLFRTEHLTSALHDGIHVGQRLRNGQLPSGVRTVVDLACEFDEPEQMRSAGVYINFPILDGVSPDPEKFDAFLDDLLSRQRPLYIHCASGRGRTGLVAASIMLKLQVAKDAKEAIEQIRSRRPLIQLGYQQRLFIERLARYYQPDTTEPARGR